MLYHYTNIDVLQGILNQYSPNHPMLNFWASHCGFMNDPLEVKLGIDSIMQVLLHMPECELDGKELIPLLDDQFFDYLMLASTKDLDNVGIPYAISFSLQKDNLTLWNTYGNHGKGICLGFNEQKLSRSFPIELKRVIYRDELNELGFREALSDLYVRMVSDFKKSTGADLSTKINKLSFLSYFIPEVAPLIKHECYKYEQEYRLVINRGIPNFRNSNNRLIPYLPIAIPADALEEIYVGPDCGELEWLSVRLYLASKGLDKFYKNVKKSEVPFRN